MVFGEIKATTINKSRVFLRFDYPRFLGEQTSPVHGRAFGLLDIGLDTFTRPRNRDRVHLAHFGCSGILG
jgi:hypothetical protein